MKASIARPSRAYLQRRIMRRRKYAPRTWLLTRSTTSPGFGRDSGSAAAAAAAATAASRRRSGRCWCSAASASRWRSDARPPPPIPAFILRASSYRTRVCARERERGSRAAILRARALGRAGRPGGQAHPPNRTNTYECSMCHELTTVKDAEKASPPRRRDGDG